MKKVILITSILALGAFYVRKKANTVMRIFDRMTTEISNITILNLSQGNIRFSADIILKNNTSKGFKVDNQEFVNITEVRVLRPSKELLLQAATNIDGIKLIPNGETIIKNVIFESNLIEAATEYFSNQFKGNYIIEVKFEALGKEWVIP